MPIPPNFVLTLAQSLPDADTLFKVGGYAMIVAAAAIGGGIGVFKAVNRWRERAAQERQADADRIEERVTRAVTLVKEEFEKRLELSQELVEGYKRQSELKQREKEELEGQLKHARSEAEARAASLRQWQVKHEEIVDHNLTLQGQNRDLRTQVDTITIRITVLEKIIENLEGDIRGTKKKGD